MGGGTAGNGINGAPELLGGVATGRATQSDQSFNESCENDGTAWRRLWEMRSWVNGGGGEDDRCGAFCENLGCGG